MRIIVDLDNTVVDLYTPLLALHNTENNDDLTVERITSWNILEHVREGTAPAMEGLFARPGLFANLAPLPGAIEGVHKLATAGHDVYIVSAVEHAPGFSEKAAWVHHHLPFISKRKFILAHDKHLISADVLIDDRPGTAEAMRQEQPRALVCGVRYPYNTGSWAYHVLADGYTRPEKAWKEIVEAIGFHTTYNPGPRRAVK